MDGVILIVRHGHGRGRLPHYFENVIRHIAATAPDLYARLRFHFTGTARPALDDAVRAVVFLLADPLREMYPACYSEAVEIEDWARERGLPISNSPRALSNTIKSVQARLMTEAGILTPDTRAFETRRELIALLESAEFPVFVRADREHAQIGLHLCRTLDEALAIPESEIGYPGAVTPFVDTRAGYRSTRPGTVWARFYHKKRSYVFGEIVRDQYLSFSQDPIVSSTSSTYKRLKRYSGLMHAIAKRHPTHRETIREELAHLSGPPEAPELMRRAARALDLDFVAFDYSTFADGRHIIWEANPYPYIPHWAKVLRRERRMMERREAKYALIARYFRSLLARGELAVEVWALPALAV